MEIKFSNTAANNSIHDVDDGLLSSFETLLANDKEDGQQKEQMVQNFLEQHSELIPCPKLLNHGLHHDVIISKFPLGTIHKTDYVYITKSSDRWQVTLVELETPDKDLFRSRTDIAEPTKDFNSALDQVRRWQIYVSDHKREILEALSPIMKPLSNNPTDFKYELYIGRSKNKNLVQNRKEYILQLIQKEGIDIYSYDSLISWYRNGNRSVKNVLSPTKTQYRFKHLHKLPSTMLGFLGPEQIQLSTDQKQRLLKEGYDISEWSKGNLLTFNGKKTKFRIE